MSPRFVLGRENVPCVTEVVNRSLKADCTDFTIIGRSHSIGAINFTTQDLNRLMQLRPFYFDIQINVSP